MLVLNRRPGEGIAIGKDIFVLISSVTDNKVKICIQAPPEIKIVRDELLKVPLPLESTYITHQDSLVGIAIGE